MHITVLADDLTGANAVAALLSKEGFRSTVHLASSNCFLDGDSNRHGERLANVVNTGTRNVASDEVSGILHRFAYVLDLPSQMVALRIDSTLRGTIPGTIDFLLQHRPDDLAFVVPAFPSSGRTTKDAVHYVDGIPVHQTPVGHDPFSPVPCSDLRVVIGEASRYKHACLKLTTIRAGLAEIDKVLSSFLSDGVRVVLSDAVTDEDLDTLALAANNFSRRHPPLRVLPVDPGPFTAAMARCQCPVAPSDQPVILGVSASIMHNAKQQMDYLERDPNVCMYHYSGESADEVIHGFTPRKSTIFLRTDTWDLPREKASSVVRLLPGIVGRIVAEFPTISGIYLSGGEAADCILTGLGVNRLALEEEIAPLTALSRPLNGLLKGKWVVTKGGSIGDEAAVSRTISQLQKIIFSR